MAINDTQKIDYLWKKLGYGVAKTDVNSIKNATNESIASPLINRGDTLWTASQDIPSSKPSATTTAVELYDDAGGGQPTVQCTADTTASPNRTWKTNLIDWIPPEFGSTYQIKVYLDNAGAPNPQTSGTQLFAAGSGNNDEWFFDYQSGVLNFIGDNLPSGISGKSIYIVGARYVGNKGTNFGAIDANEANLGNFFFSGNTMSTTNTDGEIILHPDGDGRIILRADVQVDSTGAITIPVGTTLERPATLEQGMIRYNTTDSTFEGYDGTNWGSLGGVKDVDGNTYIIAETSAGANNNDLDFYTDGVQRLQIDETGDFLFGDGLNKFTVDWATGNTYIAGTLTVDGDVTFKSGASGSINLGDDNTDNVVFNADVNSSIIPDSNDTYDLGSSTQAWRDLYLSESVAFVGATTENELVFPTNLADALSVTDGVADFIVFDSTTGANQISITPNTNVAGIVNIDNTTQSTASTNGALVVDGGVGIAKDVFIAGSTNVGTDLTVTGTTTLNGDTDVGDANTDTVTFTARVDSNFEPSANDTYDLGATGVAWRDIYLSESVTFEGATTENEIVFPTNLADGLSLTDGTNDFIVFDSTTGANALNITPNTNVAGIVNIDNTTQSTSTSTGALVVDGGVGIAKDVNIAGSVVIDTNLTVNGNTDLGDANTDTVTFVARVDSNIEPSATDTYDLGATGVAWKDLYLSESVTFEGATTENELVFPTNLADALSVTDGTNDFIVFDSTTGANALNITPNTNVAGIVNIDNTTQSTATTDGALVVDGGVGIAKDVFIGGSADIAINLHVAGNADVDNNLNVDGNTTLNGDVDLGDADDDTVTFNAHVDSSVIPAGTVYDLGNSTNSWRAIYLGEDINFVGATGNNEIVVPTNLADALSIRDSAGDLIVIDTTTGSQVVSITPQTTLSSVNVTDLTDNRIVIAGTSGELEDDANFRFDGTNFDIGAAGSETFRVVVASGNTSVGGDLSVTGDLTVNGTTTTVNSTTVTIDDPVFTLGGDSAPTTDDNKDRGIEFNWYDGEAGTPSAKVGFFGFDDSSRKFTYIPDATNSSEVFSGAVGDAVFGNMDLGSATINAIQIGISASNEIDTTAGDLVLDSFTGQVQVDDNLDVTGNVTIDGTVGIGTGTFTNANSDADDLVISAEDTNVGLTILASDTSGGLQTSYGSANIFFATEDDTNGLAGRIAYDWTSTTDILTVGTVATNGSVEIRTANNVLTVDFATDQSSNFKGIVNVDDTTQSTSTSTGALVVDGGVGIAKNVNIGGSVDIDVNLNVDGNTTLNGDVDLGDANTDTVTFNARVDSNIEPSATDTYDLGTSTLAWRDIYLSESVTFKGATTENELVFPTNLADALSVTDGTNDFIVFDSTTGANAITVTPNTNFLASVDIDVNLNVDGNTTLNGNTDVGDANTDTVTFNARVDSDFVPSATDTYDLGTSTLGWKDLHLTESVEFHGATTENEIVFPTNLADALSVNDGVSDFIVFDSTTGANALNITPNTNIAGILNVDNTTGSTSTSTGALIVDGGVGIAENLYVGGNVDVAGNVTITGNITIGGDTDSGDADTDTISFAADVDSNFIPDVTDTYDLGATGKAWKDLYLTESVTFEGATTENEIVFPTNLADGLSITDGTNDFIVFTSTTGANALNITPNTNIAGIVNIDNTTQSTDSTTGALVVDGGVGIAKDVNIDGSVVIDTNLTVNGNTDLGDANTDTVTFVARVDSNIEPSATDTYDLGTSLLGWKDLYLTESITFLGASTENEIVIPTAETDALSITDGSFELIKIDTTTNASIVTIGNDLVVGGDLTVNGTTTTVNSTTVTIDDPIFTLGGDTAPTVDDNKDRGIEFNWYDGEDASPSAKVGFFGFDDSTRKFTFIPDATNNSEVFSGTAGDAVFGDIDLTTATVGDIQLGVSASNEIDTTVGNLILDSNGGTVQVDDNLNVTGNADVDGDLNVDGNTTLNGNVTLGDATDDRITFTGQIATDLVFQGATDDTITTTFAITDPTTSNKTITFPDASGTVAVSVSDTTTTTQAELNIDHTLNAEGNISTTGNAYGLSTTDNPTFAGVTAGNIQVAITDDNEIDTSSGNLTLDSAGGTVQVDDNLNVTGSADIDTDLNVDGNTTLNGNVDLGDANTDTVTFNAQVDSDIVPSANDTYDLGTSLLGWKDLHLTESVEFHGATTENEIVFPTNLADALSITDGTTDFIVFTSTTGSLEINVTPNTVFAGDIDVSGHTTLGTDSADDIIFNGLIKSDVIPDATDTYDLGTSTLAWKDVYLSESLTFVGATTENEIIVPTNLADALSVKDSVGDIIVVDTSTGANALNITPNTNIAGIVNIDNTTQSTASTNGALVVDGGVGIAKDVNIAGSVDIDTNLNVDGDTTLNGNTDVGDASTDTVTFNATVDSNFVPNANDTYDLGISGTAWKDLYLSESLTFEGLNTENEIVVPTNLADALSITDGTGDLIVIKTTTGSQNVTITPDVYLSGNLTVSGTTTYINTTNLNVGDNIITLNADLTVSDTPTEDAGIEVNRGNEPTVSFYWDESTDRWVAGGDLQYTGDLYGTIDGGTF